MNKSIKLSLLASTLSIIGACGDGGPAAPMPTERTQAISMDDAAACDRITRARLGDISNLIGGILGLVQAEIADPKGSTDTVDAIYYTNAKSRLDVLRDRKDLHYADDGAGAVPSPATVETLPYQIGLSQQDLYIARYRTFVRGPRTSRTRTIGDKVSVVARQFEDLANDAYNCHEGITGVNR